VPDFDLELHPMDHAWITHPVFLQSGGLRIGDEIEANSLSPGKLTEIMMHEVADAFSASP